MIQRVVLTNSNQDRDENELEDLAERVRTRSFLKDTTASVGGASAIFNAPKQPPKDQYKGSVRHKISIFCEFNRGIVWPDGFFFFFFFFFFLTHQFLSRRRMVNVQQGYLWICHI